MSSITSREEALFSDALALPAAERVALVEEACGAVPPRHLKVACFLLVTLIPVLGVSAAQPYAMPRFTDPDREANIQSVIGEIDRLFAEFAAERHTPGLVWGVLLDGRLIHTGATGFANVEQRIPAAVDTRFRIASMTKSFTAMAAFKLRDAGKLDFDDRAEKYIPELRHVAPLTSDAPPITVRHLLTMTAGFPQDDPWADRLLAESVEQFRAFLRGGVMASNAAGVGFEYSNFGYALLGEVVSRAAGEPYQRYIAREILEPVGMKDTRWEFAEVPADKLALGYRWEHGAWRLEPMLGDGVYGAIGGLLTTLQDFARYVSFHLSAYPARNDPDSGPIRRATLREMHKPAEITALLADAKTVTGEIVPQAVGYGYGLGWLMDSRRAVRVGHSGGLPGFGSNYQFLPDRGAAVISFANLTYAGTGGPNHKVVSLLLDKVKLAARTVPPSEILARRKPQVAELINTWDEKLAAEIVADNFFLDRSREDRSTAARETLARIGAVQSVGEIVPENQLRGTFPIVGEKGRVDVHFTLTPEKNPRVQALRLTMVEAKE